MEKRTECHGHKGQNWQGRNIFTSQGVAQGPFTGEALHMSILFLIVDFGTPRASARGWSEIV